MRYTWVSGMRKSKFLVLRNYWMNSSFTSSPPHFAILPIHIAMLPGVAMAKILEKDLWMNSFLVKLQDLDI